MKSPILFSSLTLGGMDDQHPNLQMVTGVVDQLSGTRSLVRQLYLKGNEHLCRVKTIYREKNASFPVVMTEMKRHATDVINDLLAIEMSLLRAIEDAEVWLSSTSPLSAPPVSSQVGGYSGRVSHWYASELLKFESCRDSITCRGRWL